MYACFYGRLAPEGLRRKLALRGIAVRPGRGLTRTVPGLRTAAHGHGCRAPEGLRRESSAGGGSIAPGASRARRLAPKAVRRTPRAGSRMPEAPEALSWKPRAGSHALETSRSNAIITKDLLMLFSWATPQNHH
jgi:hypothetical protein